MPCYAPALRTEARYPSLKPDAGHYESFFLRAARPSGGEGIWIRYTIDRAPGGKPASASQTGETKSFSVSGSATYEIGRLRPAAGEASGR